MNEVISVVIVLGIVVLLWVRVQMAKNDCNQDCNQGRNCDCGK